MNWSKGGPYLTAAKLYQNFYLQNLTWLVQYNPSQIYPVVCSEVAVMFKTQPFHQERHYITYSTHI